MDRIRYTIIFVILHLLWTKKYVFIHNQYTYIYVYYIYVFIYK